MSKPRFFPAWRPFWRAGRWLGQRCVVALAALAAGLPLGAVAADWKPDRPVTMVVRYAAGGGTDAQARVVAVDAIPLGATGKILKTRLREQLKDYALPTAAITERSNA